MVAPEASANARTRPQPPWSNTWGRNTWTRGTSSGRLAGWLRKQASSLWSDDPIRGELFSVERLEEHGRSLALAHPIAAGRRGDARLFRRLADNEATLVAAYRDVADAIEQGAAITPAAEWLIDNFHVVETQLRNIRSDLPQGYYRQLPRLAGGAFSGLPRVFGLTWDFVAHTDSLFDPDALRRYVRAYQDVQPLVIGELWAVAITLRIVLVENLRRIAGRVVASREGRRQADALADRLLGAGGLVAEPADAVLGDQDPAPRSEAFFVQLVQRLRDQDPSIAPALAWIDQSLAARGLTADGVVQAEHQRQVAGSISVRNIITSMRLISDVDWSELVERFSLIDELLGGQTRFAEMDFPTRDLYRRAIEELARGSGREELDVAHAALAIAAATRPATSSTGDERLADPGYYLLAGGRRRLEVAIGYQAPIRDWPSLLYRSMGIGGYVGAGAVVAALFLALPLIWLGVNGLGWPWLLGLSLVGLAPAVDLSVALVNHVVTRGYRATLLPGFALEAGVPDGLRTLVAVPTLLTSLDAIHRHIELLEIHHLASLTGDLHYALLTDWTDADGEHADGDEALLAAARQGVAELNRRYGPAAAGDRFLLLHRRRVWNESERRWIGWERKRGKLVELNRLLRGAKDTSYLDPPPIPEGVRYVITLDGDTRLPRETVRRLIGKMAHPLNRPRLDPELGRVVEGYAILQPRVTPSLPVGQHGSLFLRVFSSATGIDPYAAAVSDVYQDLFGEGSYTGKGIYDIDAFEAALEGRVPESRLLSHDLFEGIFARAGLASDVEVVEDFPARYDVAASRHHRWARGDWQLLPWMLGLGRSSGRGRRGDSVPMIGRWKMLDNVRRSLSAPSIVAALVAGWAAPADSALVWTAFVLTTMAVPPLLPVLSEIAPSRPGVELRSHLRDLAGDLRLAFMQLVLMSVFLAHQAWLMGDAILRTLARLVTRRHLLEWTPAAQAAHGRRLELSSFYGRMFGAVVIAAIAIGAAWIGGGYAWPFALGFSALWVLSPAVALRASLSPRVAGREPLPAAETQTLRLVARRTWRFFETFVTDATNRLPPDNFQETPEPVVAPRTSPTNIGLYLLSVASARDFGWIGDLEAVERLEATLATMAGMARFRGHFYNWYDTGDLRPLDPKYVSSVDSGNLAGHLIALAGACRSWAQASASKVARIAGVGDPLLLARQAAADLGGAPSPGAALTGLIAELDALQRVLEDGGWGGWADLAPGFERVADAARQVAIDEGEDASADIIFWTEAMRRSIESHGRDREPDVDLRRRLESLERQARELALAMDFRFLLDPDRLLLSIGYQTDDGTRDPSCYDLLASEARLASFLAIAKGDAPARHWFRLGRAVTPVDGGAALISWSGSMFEYLMPSLVMQGPTESLIEQTNRLIVERQINYGRRLGGPWGVSESAFNARDLEFTYQYSNFGVPGLGLKRGLADNAVIAPYATALATMIDPHAAVRNFQVLVDAGGRGRYGFYEALDLTPSRVPDGERVAVVRAFMAHHQGMSIVAIADTLLDGLMRERFHADPIVRATELLLQERVPRDVVGTPPSVAETAAAVRDRASDSRGWRRASVWSSTPDTQLLSNGRYSVMITAAGSGYSTWRDAAITRWREDATCDDWGAYIFLRDIRSNEVWSAGLQPTGNAGDDYGVVFNEDRAEISRRDRGIATTLEVLVSTEDDAEVRRVTISNGSQQTCEIEVTSYAELVLAPAAADTAHPAFSKLFIETEHLPGTGALTAHRRRRSPDEPEIWAAHLAVVDGAATGQREFETDRARFLGRGGGGVRAAAAIVSGRPLSGATGAVLDPIFALRRRVRLEPGQTARIDFWTMAASTRDEIVGLIDKHHDAGAFGRATALAWTQVQVQLHHLGISHGQAGQFQRLAKHLIFATPTLRPASETIYAGRGGQPLLWSLGISGDLPIALVRISGLHEVDLVREALLAVEYWRMRRLAVDLVVLNERGASYVQDLQIALETLVRANQSRPQIGDERGAGHIFLLRADLIPDDVSAVLNAVARVVLVGERGRLEDQMEYAPDVKAPAHGITRRAAAASELQVSRPAPDMEYFNGLGGFADGGKEYVTILGPGQVTPAPWVNVIANADFGFQVSAEGGGYSWAVNSRERQLTPWSNDPLTDRPSQVLYVRDEYTGELWTATAQPLREEGATYVARHGFGHSRFQHTSRGLALDLLEYVAPEDPVRISRLSLRNTTSRRRRLSVTAYAEWCLGASRQVSAPFVTTQMNGDGAMLASNQWNPVFAERTTFFDLGGRQTSWTADRREFLGRNGSLAAPLALVERTALSGRTGAGLDPCGALRTIVDLAPGESIEVPLFLGDAVNAEEAGRLVTRYRQADLDAVLADVRGRWEAIAGAVQVKTPDRTMDLMLNGWLIYQTLSARIWARAGFYQASGAYGFRDQLQDAMALAVVKPAITRAHLLRAAARQFPEGDVQHWWLPNTGQGVRTRFSDDRVWLPYAIAQYVDVTGDVAVLDAEVPFIEGDLLEPGVSERFFEPSISSQTTSLYDHAARALDASLATGAHGLPLIGGGDWNDGMNRVGLEGRGESVWLGWFLIANLQQFAPFAEARGETQRAEAWRAHAEALRLAAERDAWDGEWYRRGWFDDGAPLGSSANDECRIDSIAQSWAVLSGAAAPDRAARAMAAVERELILPQEGLALLFAPPFDHTTHDPGYIKGYPPGIRENGGQYTHAALWSVMAYARLGEGDMAAALFWILNPINHARTRSDAYRYVVEPYVVAADVYAAPGRVGRGGWTWYTGSAAWMQRAGLEAILGVRLHGGQLEVDPCIPKSWPGFEVSLQVGATRYEIIVTNPNGVSRGVVHAQLDGMAINGRPPRFDLQDGEHHRLEVTLG